MGEGSDDTEAGQPAMQGHGRATPNWARTGEDPGHRQTEHPEMPKDLRTEEEQTWALATGFPNRAAPPPDLLGLQWGTHSFVKGVECEGGPYLATAEAHQYRSFGVQHWHLDARQQSTSTARASCTFRSIIYSPEKGEPS